MAAHYAMSTTLPLAVKLRTALDSLRESIHVLQDTAAALAQMSATQATAYFGFSDGIDSANDTVAAAAMGELASDIAPLANAAIAQMLNQFAG